MNSNIELINPHLLGVKFSWVNAGFIDEFRELKNAMPNVDAVLCSNGVIALNKDNAAYENIKTMLVNRVMPLTDEHIASHIAECERKKNTPEWDDFYQAIYDMLTLEQKRRTVDPLKKPLNWLRQLLKRVGELK